MKGTIDGLSFIKIIEHILTYNKIICKRLYPEYFENHCNILYNGYKHGAINRKLDFNITKEEFDKIISNNCYICGKQNTKIHKNGIDRFDNNKGYTIENCRPCCGTCNFIKQKNSYKDIIDKFIKIAKNHKFID